MRTTLDALAPTFVATAHRIGIAVVATVDGAGEPRTRVMQPVWEWDGATLTGWASTEAGATKVADLARLPVLSLTYWDATQDTCTADCTAERVTGAADRAAAWDRFLATPPPAGFDPAIHPEWESAASPGFAVLRLRPHRLRTMPGSLMTSGEGEVLTWSAPGRASGGG
ncbi:MAG: pyridoxamine 5'-phosphate oxidase family protein [Thermoleophilia bacterium]